LLVRPKKRSEERQRISRRHQGLAASAMDDERGAEADHEKGGGRNGGSTHTSKTQGLRARFMGARDYQVQGDRAVEPRARPTNLHDCMRLRGNGRFRQHGKTRFSPPKNHPPTAGPGFQIGSNRARNRARNHGPSLLQEDHFLPFPADEKRSGRSEPTRLRAICALRLGVPAVRQDGPAKEIIN